MLVVKAILTNIFTFAITLLPLYVPLAVFLGWNDYRRIIAPDKTATVARFNPWARDIAKAPLIDRRKTRKRPRF